MSLRSAASFKDPMPPRKWEAEDFCPEDGLHLSQQLRPLSLVNLQGIGCTPPAEICWGGARSCPGCGPRPAGAVPPADFRCRRVSRPSARTFLLRWRPQVHCSPSGWLSGRAGRPLSPRAFATDGRSAPPPATHPAAAASARPASRRVAALCCVCLCVWRHSARRVSCVRPTVAAREPDRLVDKGRPSKKRRTDRCLLRTVLSGPTRGVERPGCCRRAGTR